MIKSELVSIRNARPEDLNLILATWLRGLYYGQSWFSLIDKQVFMEHYHKVIMHLITKPDTFIKVACLKEDENQILGYAVLAPQTIHWVFVKKIYRSIGIARDLVPADSKTVTHLTTSGVSILNKKKLDFNPFAI